MEQKKPSIRVTNEGEEAGAAIIGSEAEARALLANGTSIVINYVHNTRNRPLELNRLIEELIVWDLPKIKVSAYVGGPGTRAPPPHSDQTNTFILNVRGSKKWRLCVPEIGRDDAAELSAMRLKLRRQSLSPV